MTQSRYRYYIFWPNAKWKVCFQCFSLRVYSVRETCYCSYIACSMLIVCGNVCVESTQVCLIWSVKWPRELHFIIILHNCHILWNLWEMLGDDNIFFFRKCERCVVDIEAKENIWDGKLCQKRYLEWFEK